MIGFLLFLAAVGTPTPPPAPLSPSWLAAVQAEGYPLETRWYVCRPNEASLCMLTGVGPSVSVVADEPGLWRVYAEVIWAHTTEQGVQYRFVARKNLYAGVLYANDNEDGNLDLWSASKE